MSVYKVYNIELMHALGCRQICIVSSGRAALTAHVQRHPSYESTDKTTAECPTAKPPVHHFGLCFFIIMCANRPVLHCNNVTY